MSSAFRQELDDLLNRHGMESMSDTPDYILADYLIDCLIAFNGASRRRDDWFQFQPFGKTRELDK